MFTFAAPLPVTVCGKPEEAIALVQNREDPTNSFDVVLSDVDSPEMPALHMLELFGIELATPVISECPHQCVGPTCLLHTRADPPRPQPANAGR